MADNEENAEQIMKILHIIPTLEIGGAQKLLSDLLPMQAKHDDVSLLVFGRCENAFYWKISSAGVKISHLDVNNVYNPLIISKLKAYMTGCDVVNVHLFPALYWVALASGGLKARLIYTEHSTFNSRRNHRWLRPLERWIYRKYDEVISISPQTREALNGWLGYERSRAVISNGIDLDSFAKAARGVTPDRSIVMVSRFAAAKDQATLIRAMSFIHNDIKLKLVGDGPTVSDNVELVRSLSLQDRVEFLGQRCDVADLMASSMIVVQSSHWEGFGLTAVEAMACGRPVVASDVDGLRQVVEGAGLLFKAGDEEELAALVNKLLDDSYLYEKMVAAGLERARRYGIEKTAEGYRSVYNG